MEYCPTMYPVWISVCCDAETKVEYLQTSAPGAGTMTTNYYVCTKCDKPCDIKIKEPE